MRARELDRADRLQRLRLRRGANGAPRRATKARSTSVAAASAVGARGERAASLVDEQQRGRAPHDEIEIRQLAHAARAERRRRAPTSAEVPRVDRRALAAAHARRRAARRWRPARVAPARGGRCLTAPPTPSCFHSAMYMRMHVAAGDVDAAGERRAARRIDEADERRRDRAAAMPRPSAHDGGSPTTIDSRGQRAHSRAIASSARAPR